MVVVELLKRSCQLAGFRCPFWSIRLCFSKSHLAVIIFLVIILMNFHREQSIYLPFHLEPNRNPCCMLFMFKIRDGSVFASRTACFASSSTLSLCSLPE